MFPSISNSVLGAWLLLSICTSWTVQSVAGAVINIDNELTLETDGWWQEIRSPYQNTHELVGERRPDGAIQARASIMILRHSSPEKALKRLQEEARIAGQAQSRAVAGRPALQVSDEIETERKLDDERPPIRSTTQRVTTFIVIDQFVLVVTATAASGAGAEALKRVEQLALGIHPSRPLATRELNRALATVRRAIAAKPKKTAMARARRINESPLARVTTDRTALTKSPVLAGRSGELEVAVSPDGTDVVIATNNGIFVSPDGGTTWSAAQSYPAPGILSTRGDPSVGRAPTGRFYVSYLSRERRGTAACDAPAADCRDGVSLALSEPAEHGDDFEFTSNVAICDPNDDPFGTDQPHLAISPQANQIDQEQIYVVWRRHVPNDATEPATCSARGNAHFTTQLTCSSDGGRTWAHSIKIDDNGRHPRVGIGPNGKVYVIAVRNSARGPIDLTRVSSCTDGLEIEENFPIVVDTIEGVACPVPGLDRCNNGNTLSSPTVSTDPSDPLTVFAAFAVGNGEGNEDIVVRASENGGESFPSRAIAHPSGVARRFMPWSAAVPGGVYVGWYDRTSATPALNDLTSYHAAFLTYEPDHSISTIEPLRRFAPINLSGGVPDPQCSLWPTAPRNPADSDSCSVQPQLAGVASTVSDDCDNRGPRCDFSDSLIAPAVNCCVGVGQPKYGDYNGIASAGQQAFLAWACGTAPSGASAPPPGRIGTYFAVVRHAEGSVNVDFGRSRIDFTCPADFCRVRVPVSKLCQLVIDCPACDNNRLCLGDSIMIEGLPTDATITLFDQRGRKLAEAKSKDNRHRLATGSLDLDPKMGIEGLILEIHPGKTLRKSVKHSLKIKIEEK